METQRKAIKLSVAEQLSVVTASFNLTFTEGPGPFVEQLQSLTRGFTDAASAVKAPEQPPKQNGTTPKTSSTQSQEVSNDVLEPDTPQYKPGGIPHVSLLPGVSSSNPNQPLAIEQIFLPQGSRRRATAT